MSDIWTPQSSRNELEVDEDGYVVRKIDRKLPLGEVPYRMRPDDLLLAMGRMSRDGWTRERIRKELDVYYYVAPNGVRHYVDDATFDRALAKARAFLEQQIGLWRKTGGKQGEPPESVTEVMVPKEEQ